VIEKSAEKLLDETHPVHAYLKVKYKLILLYILKSIFFSCKMLIFVEEDGRGKDEKPLSSLSRLQTVKGEKSPEKKLDNIPAPWSYVR